MKGSVFLDKMELVDPAYVEAADEIPPKREYNLKRWGMLAACVGVVVLTALAYRKDWPKISSEWSFTRPGGLLIGPDPRGILCSADLIKEIGVDYSNCDIMAKEADIDGLSPELAVSLAELLAKDTADDYVLYGAENCYVSTVDVMLFNIKENAVVNMLYAYIFTEDGEPVGHISFSGALPGMDYNIVLRHRDLNYNDILNFLSANPENQYIILTDGASIYYLDEENMLFSFSGSANVKPETVVIEGDYYHALDYERLAVSYNEIADKNNLVRVVGINKETMKPLLE